MQTWQSTAVLPASEFLSEVAKAHGSHSFWKILTLDQALPLLEKGTHPQPSIGDILSILHRSRRRNDRKQVLRLHSYVYRNELEAHTSLGNCFISMFVDVGCIDEAYKAFDALLHRNELSWNTLITGCVRCRKPIYALNLYQRLQNEDIVLLSGPAVVALLKSCGEVKDIEKGPRIHADIARNKSLQEDLYVGTALLDMYANCGSLVKAREVFLKIPVRNVVSWNALITAYARYGCDQDVIDCFEQMQLEGVSPDPITFSCVLRICGNRGDVGMGQAIHAEIETNHMLETDFIVGSALVDMYCKCGFLTKAQIIFDKLSIRDSVSWTMLISGLAEHRRGNEALKCFEQMQLEGIPIDDITLVCILKACGTIGSVEKGQQIHAKIEIQGLLGRELSVGNMLVVMYAKCGFLDLAQGAFEKLPARDIVSWNSLVTGYANHGYNEKVLQCFEQMQLEGISPSAITFACSLKACGNVGAVETSGKIHTEIVVKGLLERDIMVGNSLVDLYVKSGSLVKAQEVFDKLPVRTVVSWTSLFNGYIEHGPSEEAISCFNEMLLEGVHPDAIAFVSCLKACSCIGAIEKGENLHLEIEKRGLLEDPAVGCALISMYAKCGFLKKARKVFDKLAVQNVFSWTALISGYAEQGHGEEALDCLAHMSLEGLSPDDVTYLCILKACGYAGAIGKGREIHAQLERNGLLESDPAAGIALVDMYCKCGSLDLAQEVFDKLPVQDTTSWNSLMAGYAQLGESENVLNVFDSMLKESIKPNNITFVIILNACSRIGLFNSSLMYLEAMSRDYGIIPTAEHHACIVDIFARVGQIDMALAMVKRLPFNPNLDVWHTVLGSCRKCGNVELGKEVFKNAVSIGKQHAASYVLMSHIYSGVAT